MKEMTTEERIALIESITKNGGDLVGAQELKEVLESGEELYTYDGFEPSGQMHIAQGLIRAINTNKMIAAGFTFRMWVADWFGYLNNKMGGDLEKIKTVGRYFIEIWKASGMDLEHTEFLWTSDFIQKGWYWELVMKIARSITLKRAIRTTQIMGREESDDLSAGMIFYPCMQVADIFGVMKARVTQLGLDQQKANILAREVGEELGYWKPVIVSHGMLQGLQKPVEKLHTSKKLDTTMVGTIIYQGSKVSVALNALSTIEATVGFRKGTQELRTETVVLGHSIKFFDLDISYLEDGIIDIQENTPERMISMKMSKSRPETAIFMTDTEEDVRSKIIKAYCPEGQTEDNPVLDYCKQIIFESQYLKRAEPILANGIFVVERKPEHGGTVTFASFEALEKAYAQKEIFPLDLKNAVIVYINKLLQPVRDHFAQNEEAKALLEEVQSYQVTR